MSYVASGSSQLDGASCFVVTYLIIFMLTNGKYLGPRGSFMLSQCPHHNIYIFCFEKVMQFLRKTLTS